MKIILATGIYPPDIGGPATYVHSLARELTKKGHKVMVMTYDTPFRDVPEGDNWPVIRVGKHGGMFARWKRYANELLVHGLHADAIIVFSSVSCGIPLWLSGLRKKNQRQRLVLRLGGDFFWERYTALKGMRGLREWYGMSGLSLTKILNAVVMPRLLRMFDHIVYSSEYQQHIHEEHYMHLPVHSVLQNALPEGKTHKHAIHNPARMLFLGRFVGFKNIHSLICGLNDIPHATLSLVGEGPMYFALKKLVIEQNLGSRVTFHPAVSGDGKAKVFAEHDLMIIPSITEISPNAALEARSAGLPVLLTQATGLSDQLTTGMIKAKLQTPSDIALAVKDVLGRYEAIAQEAAKPAPVRPWAVVAEDWEHLLTHL